jgi:sugar phosphate isomerase/epimerase
MVRYSYILVDPLSSFGSEDDIRRALALLRDCGYAGVEINLTEPLGVAPERLKGWLAELGLVVPAFLTGAAYSEGLCLSSPDQTIRGEAVRRLVRYVEIGQEFNAILVIGLMQGLPSDEPDVDVANRRIVECLRKVADAAEDRRVKMVIEPVNHLQVGFNNSVAEVLRLIERVKSSSVRPMVDTIHLNIEEKSLVQPILDCGSDLGHIHLCESNGSLFGSGNIDFRSVLKALGDIDYDGFASVKVYRRATLEVAARSSIEFLRSLRRHGLKRRSQQAEACGSDQSAKTNRAVGFSPRAQSVRSVWIPPIMHR